MSTRRHLAVLLLFAVLQVTLAGTVTVTTNRTTTKATTASGKVTNATVVHHSSISTKAHSTAKSPNQTVTRKRLTPAVTRSTTPASSKSTTITIAVVSLLLLGLLGFSVYIFMCTGDENKKPTNPQLKGAAQGKAQLRSQISTGNPSQVAGSKMSNEVKSQPEWASSKAASYHTESFA